MSLKSLFKGLYSVKSVGMSIDSIMERYPSRRSAGVATDVNSAMQLSTVYACIRDKAESIGQLPVKLHKKSKRFDEEIAKGRYHRIFTQRPNDFMTMQDFIETIETNLEARERKEKGLAYAIPNDYVVKFVNTNRPDLVRTSVINPQFITNAYGKRNKPGFIT